MNKDVWSTIENQLPALEKVIKAELTEPEI